MYVHVNMSFSASSPEIMCKKIWNFFMRYLNLKYYLILKQHRIIFKKNVCKNGLHIFISNINLLFILCF